MLRMQLPTDGVEFLPENEFVDCSDSTWVWRPKEALTQQRLQRPVPHTHWIATAHPRVANELTQPYELLLRGGQVSWVLLCPPPDDRVQLISEMLLTTSRSKDNVQNKQNRMNAQISKIQAMVMFRTAVKHNV